MASYKKKKKAYQAWGRGQKKPKNMKKKDQESRKQSQLEPKLRPVHEIYPQKTIGKPDPSLTCPQRYPQ